MTDRTATQATRQRFGRAAANYDRCARVQREAAARLLSLLDAFPASTAGTIVDAGCGTGQALGALAAHHPGRRLLAVDLALPMLRHCRQLDIDYLPLAADLQALPLAAASVAGLWSNFTLQWCEPRRSAAEIARVLSTGGRAWLATLGPRTFHELRHAFAGLDGAGHVLDCPSPEDWQQAITAAGLQALHVERQTLEDSAESLQALLRGIKAIGAQGIGGERRRSLLGKRAWQGVVERYEVFRRSDGGLPATYDVLFMVLARR